MAYRYEKNYAGGQDIVIDGWEKGISQSPYSGLADVKNVNINDIPGSFFANTKTVNDRLNSNSVDYLGAVRTFTADASTDIITISSSLQQDYMAVTFTSSGTLPAGLSLATTYYLRFQTTTTFKVSTTLANAISAVYVNITGAGTGTHTMTVTNIAAMQATCKDNNSGSIYGVDTLGQIWTNTTPGGTGAWMLVSGNTLTQTNGNGIAVWQNYLFAFRNRNIDVFGPLTDLSTAAWSNSWQTMNASTSYDGPHKTLVGADNVLYWTDFDDSLGASQRLGYVGSVRLAGASAFAPGTGATFTYNNNSLDFPSNEEPAALAEVGTYLSVGVNIKGVNSKGNHSKLYWWDRVSASYFNPIIIPEAPVTEMVSTGNLVYIFTNLRGRVYKSNLSSLAVAFKIPDHLYVPGSTSSGYEGQPLGASYVGQSGINGTGGARIINFTKQARIARRKIYFGVNLYGGTGLYSFDTEAEVLQMEAAAFNGYASSLTDATQVICVETQSQTSFLSQTSILMFGTYYNGTTSFTIDKWDIFSTGDNNYYGNYNGYIITDLVNTGTDNNKKTFQQLEYKLDRKMISGSGLKIYYRNAIGEAWTLLSTEDFSTYGGIISRVIDFTPTDMEWVQLKIELNRNTVVRELRLR